MHSSLTSCQGRTGIPARLLRCHSICSERIKPHGTKTAWGERGGLSGSMTISNAVKTAAGYQGKFDQFARLCPPSSSQMSLSKELSLVMFGWGVGVVFAPGWLLGRLHGRTRRRGARC